MAGNPYETYAENYYSYHTPEGGVHKTLAGHDVIIKLEGYEVGRAQSISGSRDFGIEQVMEIGSIKPQEFTPLRFSGSLTLERYFVRNDDLLKILKNRGIPFDLSKEGLILLHSVTGFEIEIRDKYTGKLIRAFENCVLSSTDETIAAAGIAGERATIVYSEARGDTGTTNNLSETASSGAGA